MKLGRVILEEKLPGNRRRREALGLPWLVYRSQKYEMGEALADAEQETGRDVKIGLWKSGRVPREAILIGKYMGEAGEPELPLYVVADAPAAERAARSSRAALTERVLVRIASRLIRLEKQLALYRLLTLVALGGLIAALVLVALLFLRRGSA